MSGKTQLAKGVAKCVNLHGGRYVLLKAADATREGRMRRRRRDRHAFRVARRCRLGFGRGTEVPPETGGVDSLLTLLSFTDRTFSVKLGFTSL